MSGGGIPFGKGGTLRDGSGKNFAEGIAAIGELVGNEVVSGKDRLIVVADDVLAEHLGHGLPASA